MLPHEAGTKFAFPRGASAAPAVMHELRGLPKIANALANFVAVAAGDDAAPDTALKKAAADACSSLLGTFQSVLQLAEGGDWKSAPKPNNLAGSPPEDLLREHYGFIPRIFQSQTGWPELLAAEVRLIDAVVFEERSLSRGEKERILLACAIANGNEYGCALHFGILKLLGEEAGGSAMLQRSAPGDDSLERLAWETSTPTFAHDAAEAFAHLRASGLSQEDVLETLAVCAVGNMLHSLQASLQPTPDFPPPSIGGKVLYPRATEARPTAQQPLVDDPDAAIVAAVKNGDTEAFAGLIRSHSRRVFGTLLGLLGDAEEARDVSQEAFLKAFQSLHRFEGRSKFSSWLMSIAINTGTEVLRKRKNFEPIDTREGDEEWRPRQIQEWSDNPEECFAKEEINDIVRRGVMRLPPKYRIALLMRDVSQLSTEEAADALGLSVPALKARVLRGRLMLRETLAPHFASARERGAHG